MLRHSTYFRVFAALLFCSSVSANKLGDIVDESNAGWLIGAWSEHENATTQVTFEWQLDKHSIVVKFDSDSTKARGLITFRAHDNKVLYVAADNRGATGSGEWTLSDGHPTLLYKQVSGSGQETNAGFRHKKVDEKTMIIEIYELDKDGQLTGMPIASPQFVRR